MYIHKYTKSFKFVYKNLIDYPFDNSTYDRDID